MRPALLNARPHGAAERGISNKLDCVPTGKSKKKVKRDEGGRGGKKMRAGFPGTKDTKGGKGWDAATHRVRGEGKQKKKRGGFCRGKRGGRANSVHGSLLIRLKKTHA